MSHAFMEVLRTLKDSSLSRFSDAIIQDGSSFALHKALAGVFPGRFTTVSPAAVELHTTMSLFHDTFTCVTVTPDTECERHHLPEPSELENKLLLADRGYDGREYLNQVDECGGHFLVRSRSCLDPIVKRIHHHPGRRYQELEVKRLSVVIESLPKKMPFDLDIFGPTERDKNATPSAYCFVTTGPNIVG